jgi:hypothetical protein
MGKRWLGRCGAVRVAWRAWDGMDRYGPDQRGLAGEAAPGMAGEVRRGMAGMAGMAGSRLTRQGPERYGGRCKAGPGVVGGTGRGRAWTGGLGKASHRVGSLDKAWRAWLGLS